MIYNGSVNGSIKFNCHITSRVKDSRMYFRWKSTRAVQHRNMMFRTGISQPKSDVEKDEQVHGDECVQQMIEFVVKPENHQSEQKR